MGVKPYVKPFSQFLGITFDSLGIHLLKKPFVLEMLHPGFAEYLVFFLKKSLFYFDA